MYDVVAEILLDKNIEDYMGYWIADDIADADLLSLHNMDNGQLSLYRCPFTVELLPFQVDVIAKACEALSDEHPLCCFIRDEDAIIFQVLEEVI